MLVMIVLHEGLHGLFFWLFTREKPKFAFKGFYAYAAMPDWYLPKKEYLITALAPLVGITLLGVLGLALLPGWADAALGVAAHPQHQRGGGRPVDRVCPAACALQSCWGVTRAIARNYSCLVGLYPTSLSRGDS